MTPSVCQPLLRQLLLLLSLWGMQVGVNLYGTTMRLQGTGELGPCVYWYALLV